MPWKTHFLGRLIGLGSLILGAAMILGRSWMVESVTALVHDRPLLLIAGLLNLVAGLAISIGHNVWSGGALPILVSAYGWLMLLRGVAVLVLSPDAMATVFEGIRFGQLFYVFAAVNIAIGSVFTWLALCPSTPRPNAGQ